MAGCGDAGCGAAWIDSDDVAISRRRRAGIPHSRECRTPSCPSGRPAARAATPRRGSSARPRPLARRWRAAPAGSGWAISTRTSPHIGSRPAGSRRRRYQLATVRARGDVMRNTLDRSRCPRPSTTASAVPSAYSVRWRFTTPTVHERHGHRLAAADAAVDEQPVALRGAPSLGQPPLELLAVRLDAVVGCVLEGERVCARRALTVRRVDQLAAGDRRQRLPRSRSHEVARGVHARLDQRQPPGCMRRFRRSRTTAAAVPTTTGCRQVRRDLAALSPVEEPAEARQRPPEDPSGFQRPRPLQNRCADQPGGV